MDEIPGAGYCRRTRDGHIHKPKESSCVQFEHEMRPTSDLRIRSSLRIYRPAGGLFSVTIACWHCEQRWRKAVCILVVLYMASE